MKQLVALHVVDVHDWLFFMTAQSLYRRYYVTGDPELRRMAWHWLQVGVEDLERLERLYD